MVSLLQPLVFSGKMPVEGAAELYIRGSYGSDTYGSLSLPAGESIDFFTYFNLFSSAKWRGWTGAENIGLILHGSGRAGVELTGHDISSGRSCALLNVEYNLEDEEILRIPEQDCFDVITFKVAADTECRISGGGWYGKTELERDVRAAVVICTFNREEYLWPNLESIIGVLPISWQVFVINQGTPFSEEKMNSMPETVRFFKNPNRGGSGGFTRGIVEALQAEEDFTHALLMDDDIRLEPSVLNRTNRLLVHLKPEYRKHFAAGAMIRMDNPLIQHECGAYWSGIRVKHSFHNLDLGLNGALLENEAVPGLGNHKEYAAWWYCAVPLSQDMLDDLPMPFFVNGDDIEYSLRRAPGLLRLNGISVWHEPFLAKASALKRYLTIRNGLIINVRADVPFLVSLFFVCGRWARMLLQRNNEGRVFIKLAVMHFLDSPDKLWDMCGPKLFEIQPDIIKTDNFIRLILKFVRYYKKAKTEYRNISLDLKTWRINVQ